MAKMERKDGKTKNKVLNKPETTELKLSSWQVGFFLDHNELIDKIKSTFNKSFHG